MISIFDSHFCFPQVDAPRDPTLSVGEMLKRLQEHVLSPVGEVVLAIEATETGAGHGDLTGDSVKVMLRNK